MSLLIDIRMPEWMSEASLAEELAPHLPDVRIRVGPEGGPLDDVVMIATSQLDAKLVPRTPNLRAVQKLGAGVETIVNTSGLPDHVRVARLAGDGAANEIAEYSLAYVLAAQRNTMEHQSDGAEARWRQIAPRLRSSTTVAVLGLGHIGGRTAALFAGLGFQVLGWSRSAKDVPGVDCRNGPDALPGVLAKADHVCAILPSTDETRDLLDAEMLSHMKSGAQLINCGRGDLIVDADLLAALDTGPVGHAVLDVFRREPLPEDHAYWRHPKVTVTPHVLGWRVDDAFTDVAEDYRRLVDGRPLLNEVDRRAGY